MLRLAAALALGLALLLAPSRARAQSQQDLDRLARTEFSAGRDAFSHGDYPEAARRFENAYQLSQRRELLYNIGTSYERLHRWGSARDAFRHYLQAFPAAPERDELRGRLAVIETEILRENERAIAASRPPSSSRPIERVIVREVPADTHPLRTAAFVTGGLGALALIASLTIGLITNGYYDGLVTTCGQTEAGCSPPVIDDVQQRATFTNVFAIGGAALAVGAVVLYAVDATRQGAVTARRAVVWPGHGPHLGFTATSLGGAVGLTGAF